MPSTDNLRGSNMVFENAEIKLGTNTEDTLTFVFRRTGGHFKSAELYRDELERLIRELRKMRKAMDLH